jgi:hypothetical protein
LYAYVLYKSLVKLIQSYSEVMDNKK